MNLHEITQEGLAAFNGLKNEAKEGLDLSLFVNKRPAAQIVDGIAHVWVFGPLLRNPAPIEIELGATGYEQIADELKGDFRAVMLHIDSPGGTVAGCIEVARLVEGLKVPVVAFVHGCACSAAYKIACGADYIVAKESATVGNIGSILVTADTSAAWEGMGIVFNAFTNEGADLKSTGHLPNLSESQREFLQESINDAGAAFRNHVLRNRSVSDEVFRAGWYSGEKALALGLIDEIGNEETAMERLTELLSI